MRSVINTVTRRSILTAMFILSLAASAAAAPQRGGGHFGGGHVGGGGPRGHFDSGPHGRFGGSRGHFHEPHIIVRGGFFDPFWGFYYPGYGYPYGYPYWSYDSSLTPMGSVKTEITPKQTEVYVDGYYAGVADDFDGAFQRLHTSPGGHAVTLRLEGYRTVTQSIYVRRDSTYKLRETMEKLAPGEVSEPVPVPTLPTGRSDGMTHTPDGSSAPRR
jgi:PEGA domain